MRASPFLASALVAVLALGTLGASCGSQADGSQAGAPRGGGESAPGPPPADDRTAGEPVRTDGYRIVHTYPHDRGSYTQGLVYHAGHLYESTGRHGESTVRKVVPETGQVVRRAELATDLFGEGLTLWKGVLVQLTWKSGRAIVWDERNFQELYHHEYEGQGWGLTHDGDSLIKSDGTHVLTFHDPGSFEERRSLEVTLDGRPLSDLNELEYVDGEIWANVYQREYIVRIDPETGKVCSVVDLRGLQAKQGVRDPVQDVLNGIAHDAENGRIFVTGKYWPNLYEIEVVPQ